MEVVGVGDVCSFAQMDVRKHGNPEVSLFIAFENSHESLRHDSITVAAGMNYQFNEASQPSFLHSLVQQHKTHLM